MRLTGTLNPEWEAIIGAVIVGFEAAAYAGLAICTAILVMTGAAHALRRAWR